MKATVEHEKTKEQSVGQVNAKRDDANLEPAISFTVFSELRTKKAYVYCGFALARQAGTFSLPDFGRAIQALTV